MCHAYVTVLPGEDQIWRITVLRVRLSCLRDLSFSMLASTPLLLSRSASASSGPGLFINSPNISWATKRAGYG